MQMTNIGHIAKINKKKGRERHKPHHFQNRPDRVHPRIGNPGCGLHLPKTADPKEKTSFSGSLQW